MRNVDPSRFDAGHASSRQNQLALVGYSALIILAMFRHVLAVVCDTLV
jgi:hypothetical protein